MCTQTFTHNQSMLNCNLRTPRAGCTLTTRPALPPVNTGTTDHCIPRPAAAAERPHQSPCQSSGRAPCWSPLPLARCLLQGLVQRPAVLNRPRHRHPFPLFSASNRLKICNHFWKQKKTTHRDRDLIIRLCLSEMFLMMCHSADGLSVLA